MAARAFLGWGFCRVGAKRAAALAQDQDCLGGCFPPSNAFDGMLAVVRGRGFGAQAQGLAGGLHPTEV